jgi:cellobiose-specific phosphotransferase system component IIB
MLKIEIVLDEEQIKYAFENAEVKFSKKKMKDLLDNVDYADLDIKEQLEEALKEILEEMISDEWGN